MVRPLTDLHYAFLSEGLKRPHATFESEEVAAFLGVNEREAGAAVDRLWKMKALHSDFAGIFIVTHVGRDLLQRWQQTQEKKDAEKQMLRDVGLIPADDQIAAHIRKMTNFAAASNPSPDDPFMMTCTTISPRSSDNGNWAYPGMIFRRSEFDRHGAHADLWLEQGRVRRATPEEVENAKKPKLIQIDTNAFVLKVTTTNPSLPKWGRYCYPGQVIRRSDFRQPAVTVDDWFNRDMIWHATVEEVEAFDQVYREATDHVSRRDAEINAFRANVQKRIEAAVKHSEKAVLFLELIKEWQDQDSRCRHLWHHSFEGPPSDPESAIRQSLAVQRALFLPVETGEILAHAIEALAEPLMVKSEGYNIPTTPFRDFFLALKRQDQHPDIVSFAQVKEVAERLRLRLQHDEEEDLKRQRAEFEKSGQKPLRITEFIKHYKPPQGQQSPTIHTVYVPAPRSPDAESKPETKPKKIGDHNWYEVSKHPILVAIVVGIATGCGLGLKALWTYVTASPQTAPVAQTTPATPNQMPTSQASAVNPPAGTPTPAYQMEEILQEVTVEVGSRNYPAGDDGRASPDFFTPFDKRTKWVILLPAPEVDTLMFDVVFEKSPAGFVGGKTERTGIIRNVRNGAVISGLKGDLTYISNVRGHQGPFKIQIIKAE